MLVLDVLLFCAARVTSLLATVTSLRVPESQLALVDHTLVRVEEAAWLASIKAVPIQATINAKTTARVAFDIDLKDFNLLTSLWTAKVTLLTVNNALFYDLGAHYIFHIVILKLVLIMIIHYATCKFMNLSVT
jgi:hypothetical protein